MGCFTSGSLSPDYITDDHTIGDATVILFLLFAMVCLLILIGALCRYLKNQNFNADSNSQNLPPFRYCVLMKGNSSGKFILSLKDDHPPAYCDFDTKPLKTPGVTVEMLQMLPCQSCEYFSNPIQLFEFNYSKKKINFVRLETLLPSQSKTEQQSGKLEPQTKTLPHTYNEALVKSQENLL